mgnify:CR=1 FL=1
MDMQVRRSNDNDKSSVSEREIVKEKRKGSVTGTETESRELRVGSGSFTEERLGLRPRVGSWEREFYRGETGTGSRDGSPPHKKTP